jgi:hypothetical protein
MGDVAVEAQEPLAAPHAVPSFEQCAPQKPLAECQEII